MRITPLVLVSILALATPTHADWKAKQAQQFCHATDELDKVRCANIEDFVLKNQDTYIVASGKDAVPYDAMTLALDKYLAQHSNASDSTAQEVFRQALLSAKLIVVAPTRDELTAPQIKPTQSYKLVVPFRLENGLIRVALTVNGRSTEAILDSGATMNGVPFTAFGIMRAGSTEMSSATTTILTKIGSATVCIQQACRTVPADDTPNAPAPILGESWMSLWSSVEIDYAHSTVIFTP